MKFRFLTCLFVTLVTSNQLFCSSQDDSFTNLTKPNKKSRSSSDLSNEDTMFFEKLYSKKYSNNILEETPNDSENDSLEDFNSADTDSEESEDDSREFPQKSLFSLNILEKSDSDTDSNLKDSDFLNLSEDRVIFSEIQSTEFHSTKEILNIFKCANYDPISLNSREILYTKFVIHLFKAAKWKEIEEQFVGQIPEISPPSTEDNIEKNRRECLKEDIEISLLTLEKKLEKAPKFFKQTMEILNNPLCFIPIHEDIYETFKEITQIKLPSVFLPPLRLELVRFVHTKPPRARDAQTIYLKLPSDISPDIGLRFYRIDDTPYMTLKESNIQKCDLLLENWKCKKVKSPRKKCFEIIHLLGDQKRKDFLKNDDFDKALRKSIVE